MAALSDYAESGLLHHLFRGEVFSKPSNISIALTSGVVSDADTGATIPEVPSGIGASGTGYTRIDLGDPSVSGDAAWKFPTADFAIGSGVLKNCNQLIFNTALHDWGWVSGIAIVDSSTYGAGNVIMHAQLDNPRVIYLGDAPKYDTETLQISFK